MTLATPDIKKKSMSNSTKSTPPSAIKLSGKRPRQDDEFLNLNSVNPKLKKMKKNVAEDDSDEDVVVASDSEDEDSDEIEDEDESASEDEDEDDEDVDVDEDDDDEDEKVTKKPTNPAQKPEIKEIPKQKATPVESKPSKSSSNFVLFNFDHLNRGELFGFLNKRGLKNASIDIIKTPVALIGVKNDEDAKVVSSCTGVKYKSKKLAALSVTGDVSAIEIAQKLNPNLTCVFAYDLPKTMTEANIRKIIDFKPETINLITSGPKNTKTNACYINCATHEDACKALNSLSDREESGVRIKAILREERKKFVSLTEKSFMINNLPFSHTVEDMKKEFPNAVSAHIQRKGSFVIDFKSKEDRDKAAAAKNGKEIGGRVAHIILDSDKDYAIVVSNVPFSASANDIRGLYPGCKNAALRKRGDGKPSGEAFVFFTTEVAAKQAASSTASKKLQGRQLSAVMKGEDSTPQEKINVTEKKTSSDSAKKVKNEKVVKKEVSPQIEDDSDEESDESSEKEAEDDGDEEAASDDESDEADAASDDDDDEEDADEGDDKDSGSDENEEDEDVSDEEMPEVKSKAAFKKDFASRENGQKNAFRGNFRGGNNEHRGGNFRGSGGGNNFRGGRGNNFRRPAGRFQRGGRGGRGGGFKPQWRGSN